MIKFMSFVRCTPKSNYYSKKFSDFKAEIIYVSEFSPSSKRNRLDRQNWTLATEEQAREFKGKVFFKNATFYGHSKYYIKY